LTVHPGTPARGGWSSKVSALSFIPRQRITY
jgi:hypothetical protein